MNNKKLAAEFTRVVETPNGPCLECLTISWPHPNEPSSCWKRVNTLPTGSSAEVIGAARRLLLEDPQFFGVCKMCRERQPEGWMDSERVCQSCAEGRLGVVY